MNEATEPRVARSSSIVDHIGRPAVASYGAASAEPMRSAFAPTTDAAEPFDRRFGSTAAAAGRRVPLLPPQFSRIAARVPLGLQLTAHGAGVATVPTGATERTRG